MIEMLPSLVVMSTSLWVLLDSRSIGLKKGQIKGFFNMGPLGRFLSCLLCWIVAFPAYLVKRREYLRAIASANEPIRVQDGSLLQDGDLMSQLSALADRHSQGLLTDAEFQARKRALVQQMLEQPSDDVGAATTR